MKLIKIYNTVFLKLNKAFKTEKEKKFEKVMSEFKAGKLKSSSGKIVTDRDQAIAIAMSESGQSMQKATQLLLSELKKAKVMPVGTISNGRKKVAEGKWVPVKDDKKDKKDDKKPKDKKNDKEEKTPTQISTTEKFKNTLKKMANILADALSGKDVVQPAGETVEQVGESVKKNKIKDKSKIK